MDCCPASPPPGAGLEEEIAGIYEREAGAVLRYATALAGNPDTARDAVQEAFFRFFLYRSAGQQIRSPKAWLIRVARNYVLDQKKAGSRNEIGVDALPDLPGPTFRPGPGDYVAGIMEGLPNFGLSPREMECVRLRAQDLTYEEIATVLGLEAGTVGTLLARAHGKIRKAVTGTGEKNRVAALATESRYAS